MEFSGNSQLKLIGEFTFQDCRSLKSITIPASVETIAYGAFKNNNRMYHKTSIPGTDKEKDFSDLYSLTSVKFAKGSKLKTLGDGAFEKQKALESIALPDSVEEIGEGAFADCVSFTKLDIPANVSKIGNYLVCLTTHFIDNTSKLTEVNVSKDNKIYKSIDGVVYTMDGKTLVAYPVGKTEVKFADDVTEIQTGALQGCNLITSVSIPDTITKLPVDAFANCVRLKYVTLPETLTAIDKWALQGTAVTSITIPESVTAIDLKAFEDSNLKNINGKAGSYAETYAKKNGYTFNAASSDTPTTPTTPEPTTSEPEKKNTDYSDDATGIKASVNTGVIEDGAKLSVAAVADKTNENNFTYEISFKKDDKEVQPNGKVTVKIPVPEAIKDKTIFVYYVEDGKYTDMNAKVENGFVVFETDHFSEYLVTTENKENKPGSDDTISTDTTSSADSSDGSNKTNPATGIAGGVFGIMAVAVAGAFVIVSKKRR